MAMTLTTVPGVETEASAVSIVRPRDSLQVALCDLRFQ